MAADRGHAVAQYNLGNFAYDTNDFSEAARLYGLAAAQGHTNSQYKLAHILHEKSNGSIDNTLDAIRNGRPTDRCKAMRLYALAAAKGHEDAKVALAKLKASEEETEQEYLAWKAKKRATLAELAANGDEEAKTRLATGMWD